MSLNNLLLPGLIIICATLTLTITIWDQWKVTTQESSNLLNNAIMYYGLWEHCLQTSPESYQCNYFSYSDLKTNPELFAIRILLCTSICLTIVALIVQILSNSLNSIHVQKQRKLAFTNCVLLFASGCMVLTSVIWETSEVVSDYYNPITADNNFKYGIGAAVYVGFVVGVLYMITTLLTWCLSPNTPDQLQNYSVSYSCNHPPMNLQKVSQDYV